MIKPYSDHLWLFNLHWSQYNLKSDKILLYNGTVTNLVLFGSTDNKRLNLTEDPTRQRFSTLMLQEWTSKLAQFSFR